jgi:hypothetical protein
MMMSQGGSLSSATFEKKKKTNEDEPLACRHLLHLRIFFKNDDEPRGLLSSSALEKKNKEMTTSEGGSPSSATFD